LLFDVIVDGDWNIPVGVLADHEVLARLGSITLPRTPLPNLLVWSPSVDSKLTAKQVVGFLGQHDAPMPWATGIWKSCIPPSHSFIFWHLAHAKCRRTRIFVPVVVLWLRFVIYVCSLMKHWSTCFFLVFCY